MNHAPEVRKGLSWLPSGRAGLAAMIRLIDRARHNVQLQTYIFRDDDSGRRILAALIEAAQRGTRVRVLVDALGSLALPGRFFDGLVEAGGTARIFNPLHPLRIVYRNHRKLLVCDREKAIIGGFNIGDEYNGDGLASGWSDLGLQLQGGLAEELAQSFDRMFVMADKRHRRLLRLRPASERRLEKAGPGHLLFSGPGLGRNPLKASLMRDFGKAGSIHIISPYFLPTWRMRRALMKLARKGGRVRLLLPAKSDVALSLHATRSLYERLLRAGIEILEYQPQILHAKMVIADNAVYVGSANLNSRSLHIDYELMLRMEAPDLHRQAEGLFDALASHATIIDRAQWHSRQGFWDRLRQRFAYFVIARLDPLIAKRLWRDPD